jgi:hypothetical protein
LSNFRTFAIDIINNMVFAIGVCLIFDIVVTLTLGLQLSVNYKGPWGKECV